MSISDGLVLSTTGLMFFSHNGNIAKLDMSTGQKTVVATGGFGQPFTLPSTFVVLALSPSADAIYFTDVTPLRLAKVMVSSGTVSTVVSGVYPTYIVANNQGDVFYVKGQSNTNVIYKLSSASPTTPSTFATLASDAKIKLAVDSSNNIYAYDTNAGKITQFSAAGGAGSIVATGLFFNTSVQSASVGNPVNMITAFC
jgi:hypothetical protein